MVSHTAILLAGVVWCTILGFGSNFDVSGLLEYVGISWPESASSDDWTQVAAHESFQANHADAAKYVFRSKGGRCWGPLQDMKEANKYFKEIKETGVLGLFPFNQPLQGKPQPALQVTDCCHRQLVPPSHNLRSIQDFLHAQKAVIWSLPRRGLTCTSTLQVEVNNSDIKLQGDSLVEYLERYFVAPEMQLLPQKYWDDAGWAGFEMKVKVSLAFVIQAVGQPGCTMSQIPAVFITTALHPVVA